MEICQLLQSALNFTPSMIARRYERTCLIEQLEILQKTANRMTVIIEGETGIGKTCLVNDFIVHAAALPVACLISHSDPYQETTPYHAWRSIFAQLFGHELPLESEARRQQILLHLQSLPPLLLFRLPLLNTILPLNLPENTATAQMHGKVRTDNIHALLLALLHEMLKSSDHRYVFIFEDVDWLDAASWALLRLVSQQIKPLLLILTVRPTNVPIPPSHQFLFERAATQLLHLESLQADEIAILLARRLAILHLPTEILTFIINKTKGHPFFSEQLLYLLRDSGLLRITNQQCDVANQFQYYSYTDLPETLTETIVSRFIHLAPSLQLTLKMASVIGQNFTLTQFSSLCSVETKKIVTYLDMLQKLDFLVYHIADEQFSFKNDLIQKTIHELIPISESQHLHRQIAQWYEVKTTTQLIDYYPIIAHHWLQAGDTKKAINYLVLAGEQAFNYCTYQDAVYFFQKSLQLDKNNSEFMLQLGRAYVALGKISEGQHCFEQTLKLLKRTQSTTKIGLFFSTLGQVMQQLLHRLFSRFLLARHSAEHPQTQGLIQAAYTYEQLGNLWSRTGTSTHYFAILNARLCTLNLAESAISTKTTTQGERELLVRAYTYTSVLTGLLTFSKLEELYANYALDNAENMTQLPDVMWTSQTLGMREASYGRWIPCQMHLVKAIKVAEHIGDIEGQMRCLNLLNLVHCYRGQFSEKAKQFNMLYVLARQYNDLSAQIRGLCGQAMVHLHLDQRNEAINCLKIVQSLPSEQLALNEAIWVCGLLSQVYFRQGSLQRAVQMATKTAHLIAKTTPEAFELFESYASVAHIYLLQWENANFLSKKERYACYQLSKRACDVLDDYADRFQMAKPRSWLLLGLHAWLNGHPKKARTLWEKSLDNALDLNMLYEQALVHFEIARHAEYLDEPKMQQHLQKALEIFKQLNAQYYLQLASVLSEKLK